MPAAPRPFVALLHGINVSAEALEEQLEQAVEKKFRFSVPVLVRSASSWGRYVGGNPCPGEAELPDAGSERLP